jgi:hypothetical protein
VGPELSEAPRAAACPACGSALHADAQWCSLCYHDLRPAPAPAPEPPTPAYDGLDPLTAPLLDLVLPPVPQVVEPAPAAAAPAPREPVEQGPLSWPCSRCAVPNPMTSHVCGTCGSPFLATAKETVSLVVPGIGDITHLSRGQRLAAAAAVLAAVLIPLALITFLMTPAPKPSDNGTTETTITNVNP